MFFAFKRAAMAAAFIAASAAVALPAAASDVQVVNLNTWYAFDVESGFSTAAANDWIDIVYNSDGSKLSFSFTLTQSTYFTVVDAGFSGDRFSVAITGTQNQSFITSAAADSYPASAINDYDQAFAAGFSSGSVLLTAGTYTVNGSLFASAGGGAPLNATTGALQLSVVPVPEPGTWALMVGGLALVAAGAQRRRSSSFRSV